MENLIRFIKAHGTDARVGSNGKIEALAKFSDGSAVWESIDPKLESVRNWLGY